MPVLGGTANPLLGRTLLNLLEKQRSGTAPETPPDVNLDVERARQTLDPFGFQAPTADPLYDWGRLASAILGSRGGFGPAVPKQRVDAYRQWMRDVGAQMQPHTRMPFGHWVSDLFKGPWWHGSDAPNAILQHGFKPEETTVFHRLGEPRGVSLTADPSTAEQFAGGSRVLRVWPNVDPKSVLPAWSGEAAGPLHKAYLKALDTRIPVGGPRGETPWSGLTQETIGGRLSRYTQQDVPPTPELLRLAMSDLASNEPEVVQLFNKVLSEELERQGVHGLLYSPKRYSEYELRVLDPRRAVPMELRAPQRALERKPDPSLTPVRFSAPKYRELQRFWKDIPPKPEGAVSLSDIYKLIPPERILR